MSRVQRVYLEWDQEHDYLAPKVSLMLSYRWRARRASDLRNILLVRVRLGSLWIPKVRWNHLLLDFIECTLDPYRRFIYVQ